MTYFGKGEGERQVNPQKILFDGPFVTKTGKLGASYLFATDTPPKLSHEIHTNVVSTFC